MAEETIKDVWETLSEKQKRVVEILIQTIIEDDENSEDIQHSELEHHGIKGMKWGVRRYQNADGSLTSAGKKRYYQDGGDTYEKTGRSKKLERKLRRADKNYKKTAEKADRIISKEANKNSDEAYSRRMDKNMAKDKRDWVASKLKASKIMDKNYAKYKKDTSKAKQLLTTIAFGTSYARARASGASRLDAWLFNGRLTEYRIADKLSPVKDYTDAEAKEYYQRYKPRRGF